MREIIKLVVLCIVFLASSVSEGMDAKNDTEQNPIKLMLIAEAHSSPEGMKYCYEMMRGKQPTAKMNFFIERDAERIQWATVESRLLKYDSEEEFFENFYRHHLPSVEALPDGLSGRIYGNIFQAPKLAQPGLIKNRFWLLKILRDFSNDPNIKIVPIDASFKEVISHKSFTSKSAEFDKIFADKLKAARETGNQISLDAVMKSDWALEPRDLIMTQKLKEKTEKRAINTAIVGLVHASEIYVKLRAQLEISRVRTSIPAGELEDEKDNKRVLRFYKKASVVK